MERFQNYDAKQNLSSICTDQPKKKALFFFRVSSRNSACAKYKSFISPRVFSVNVRAKNPRHSRRNSAKCRDG